MRGARRLRLFPLWSYAGFAKIAFMPIVSPKAPEALPAWLWPRAAYVHVPFCAHHCGYCDFAIATGQDQLIDPYLDALAAELATLGTPQPVQTLFLGGGTPTYLSSPQLQRLLAALNHWLPAQPGCEFSV